MTHEVAGRRIGRAAWILAWVGLVVGQVHAMARHQTLDGQGDLQQPLTRWWSDPARRVFHPLLDWADPDTVYLTWGKVWLPVFAAFTACAWWVYRQRRPAGLERWAWRAAITTYVLATLSVLAFYWLQWTGPNAVEGPADTLMFTSLPLLVISTTVLGITLVRNGFVPRLAAWLLALQLPLMLCVLQFTSLGSGALPLMFAFGLVGRRIAAGRAPTSWQRRIAHDGPLPRTGVCPNSETVESSAEIRGS